MENLNFNPLTDRGAENTTDRILDNQKVEQLSLNIDFFTATFLCKEFHKILTVFNTKKSDLLDLNFGLFGYTKGYQIKEKIIIYYDSPTAPGTMLLWLSGRGCREVNKYFSFEKLFQFFTSLECIDENGVLHRNYNITRIDIATDFYNLKYDLINRVTSWVKRGYCVSKFKLATKIHEYIIEDGSKNSNSIRFGKMSSRTSIIFYDKLKERNNNGYEVSKELKSWYRMEVNYKQENANNFFDLIKNDLSLISKYNCEVINNYIDFKEINKTDSNKSRLKKAKWWFKLINTVEKCKVSNTILNSCIMQKKQWLFNQVSKSLLMYTYCEKLKNINSSPFANILKNSLNKIKINDILIIKDYLKDNGFTVQELDKMDNQELINNFIEYLEDLEQFLIN